MAIECDRPIRTPSSRPSAYGPYSNREVIHVSWRSATGFPVDAPELEVYRLPSGDFLVRPHHRPEAQIVVLREHVVWYEPWPSEPGPPTPAPESPTPKEAAKPKAAAK
jgi:hypothetical protein